MNDPQVKDFVEELISHLRESIGGNGPGNMSFLFHYGSLCNRFSNVTLNMIAVLVLIPILPFK